MKKGKNTEGVAKPISFSSILAKHGDFELILKKKTVSYLSVGGETKVLSHWHEAIKLPNGSEILPTTQDELKAIYDESPSFKSLIKAPSSYKARWEDFKI